VTDGVGEVQSRGGEVLVVRSRDVIRTPPGREHWLGAAPGRLHGPRSQLERRRRDVGSHVIDDEYDLRCPEFDGVSQVRGR
jgi:hypothetical protein